MFEINSLSSVEYPGDIIPFCKNAKSYIFLFYI